MVRVGRSSLPLPDVQTALMNVCFEENSGHDIAVLSLNIVVLSLKLLQCTSLPKIAGSTLVKKGVPP
jgi:hypothetical protein